MNHSARDFEALSLCLVIPCFNEADRLNSDALVEYLQAHGNVSFVLVDDGSTDGTAALLGEVAGRSGGRARVLRRDRNEGKAEAVREGIREALAGPGVDYTGYWDADLAIPLAEIRRLCRPEKAMMVANKMGMARDATSRTWLRRGLSRLFSAAVRLLFGLHIRDTQTGAKIIRAELAREVFRERFLSPWLFDIEVLLRAKRALGAEAFRGSVVEVPLSQLDDLGDSRMTRTYLLRIPGDLARIWKTYGR